MKKGDEFIYLLVGRNKFFYCSSGEVIKCTVETFCIIVACYAYGNLSITFKQYLTKFFVYFLRK